VLLLLQIPLLLKHHLTGSGAIYDIHASCSMGMVCVLSVYYADLVYLVYDYTNTMILILPQKVITSIRTKSSIICMTIF